jgi:tetratricopeptide (TPR) repeat protein
MTADPPEQPQGSSTTASGQRNLAIGGGVRDSTIITGDSNVIYLGKPRNIPWRRVPVVGLPVLAVAVAAYILYPRPIPTMSGELNVAVAEFGALDAQGAAVQSADARSLADLLFGTLNAELQGINAQTSPVSSSEQNFVIQTWGPSQVGRIDGKTPEARADAAEKFATRSKAHLLIYGYLEPRSGGASFVPQFYLRNLQDTPELEGEHDLGASVLMRSLDDPDSRATLRADMTRRTRAFAEFVIGLSQYANDKVADANTHFVRAEADPQWDDSSGKDVLYLFMGYTAGKLGQLDAARGYFEHALKINPEFARAYLGLGEVRFQESLGKPEACARDSVDVAGLQDAIQLYQRSLSAKVQPDRSNVPSTTALGLGRAYLCLSQADAADHWADAEREFKLVIADYDSGNQSAIDLAADAHSNLGFVYLPVRCDPDRLAKYGKAAAQYQSALDLSPLHPTRRGFYYEMLGFIDTQQGSLDSARAAYRAASQVDPANKAHYDDLLQHVQQPAAEQCP